VIPPWSAASLATLHLRVVAAPWTLEFAPQHAELSTFSKWVPTLGDLNLLPKGCSRRLPKAGREEPWIGGSGTSCRLRALPTSTS
jgi:hypothetical protein